MSDRRKDRPPPPRSLRSGDEDPAGAGSAEDSAAKPTSVWDVVAETRPPVEEVEFPGREFEVDGECWWVQELGRTTSGRPEDAGATLILVGFRPGPGPEEAREAGEEGGEEGEERGRWAPAPSEGWEREAWVRHPSILELSHAELVGLLESAGPFRPIPDEPPPFFGPRGRRGRRGRSGGRRGGR